MTNSANPASDAFRRIESPAQPGKAAKVMRYVKPELKRNKAFVPMAKSDVILAAVQVMKNGGETTFHSHTGMDGFWFVLRGRARFYGGVVGGTGDELIAECGPHEGVFLPRGVPYWFEQTGDEELEILQVEGFAKGEPNHTVHHDTRGVQGGNTEIIGQDGKPIDPATITTEF